MKTIVKKTVLSLALGIPAINPVFSQEQALEVQTVDPITQIHRILDECLFLHECTEHENEKFSFFADWLIAFVKENAEHFTKRGDINIEAFIADMTNIRNEKNFAPVVKVLARYSQFASPTFKATFKLKLLTLLKKRLAK